MSTMRTHKWLAWHALGCFLLVLAFPSITEAHGNHPKRGKRLGQCGQASKQTERIARHTVGFAVERYQVDDLVSQEEFESASRSMDYFLRWKLGGAVPVCAQYVSTGYGHFERAYSDEGGAMLLGVLHFSRQDPELVVPDWMIKYIKAYVGMTEPTIYGYLLRDLDLPEPLALQLVQKIRGEVVKVSLDAIQSVKAYLPKKFDVKNRLVDEAIEARRSDAGASGTLPSRGTKKGSPFAKGRALSPELLDRAANPPTEEGPIGRVPPGRGGSGGASSGGQSGGCEDPYASDECYCRAFPDDQYCSGEDQFAEQDPESFEDYAYPSEDFGSSESEFGGPGGFGQGGESDSYSGSEQGPLQGGVPWYEQLRGR